MSARGPPASPALESQLLSIMDVLVKAAVAEIGQLFSESSASLRLHLSRSLEENEALRTRMKVMRSELFSLRLQTRSNRPAGRSCPIRGSLPKPRARSQVVPQPLVAQKTVGELASVSVQPEKNTFSTSTQVQCADVESPDVILIKDEDDVGGCGIDPGQGDNGNLTTQADDDVVSQNLESLDLTGNAEELRIVSVHGRGEGPLQDMSDTFFSSSELQVFSSLSPEHNVNYDTAGATDRRGMQDIDTGLTRNSQLEVNHSPQLASAVSNPAVEPPIITTDGQMGHPSHVGQFPQQQNVFLHRANKSLECSFCGKCFFSRKDLIAHRAAHTGETPITCSNCGKSFVNKTTLSIHMRIHTGEKPYVCMQCGKRFTQNGSLKIHLRIHSGEKPYSCSHCTASFNNPSNLRRHMAAHNSNVAL